MTVSDLPTVAVVRCEEGLQQRNGGVRIT